MAAPMEIVPSATKREEMDEDLENAPVAKKLKVEDTASVKHTVIEQSCLASDKPEPEVLACVKKDDADLTGDATGAQTDIKCVDKDNTTGAQVDIKNEIADIVKSDIVKSDKEKQTSTVQGDTLGTSQDGKTENSSEKNSEVLSRILESDVGIQEYISPYPGFQAVIKQRYSDFLVNEISQEGRLVELTCTDLPSDLPELNMKTSSFQSVTGLISEEEIEKLKELLASGDRTKKVLIKTSDDKSVRGKLHCAIDADFPGLDTNTVTKDEQKYIEAKITNNKGNNLRQWPKRRGDYCKFVLYKEAKDTMDAIGLISSKMRLKSSLFQYAGTKDKRAKTSQDITVYRVAAEKLKNVNKQLRNIVCGNFSYCSQKLQLGQLKGNRFTVVLRSVTGSEEQIELGMTSLRDHGFINYYGMQRFGVFSVPTHHIGRALLSCNWKEAVELILKPRAGEEKQIAEAREFWWKTRDSKGALSKFPKYTYIERNILQGLADRGGNDYMGAINKVARNTRLMYVHAYQSYIWNTVVSHRIKRHGLKPVCGDLIIPHKTFSLSEDVEDGSGAECKPKVAPTVLDDTNIGEYTIYDVVLPKPGYDVIYPTNDIEELYKELMEKDGLDYQNMRSKHKDFSLSGDNRHIVVKPEDVDWKLFRYNDVNIPLALSDLDKISNKPEPQNVEGGSSLALRLQLTLPTSCYATMALRELLKIDTSSSYQATLNT